MYDFDDVKPATKAEQVRAWSVDQALDSFSGVEATNTEIVERAARIEKFILEGMTS